MPAHPQKIAVIGTSGSGKTTVARELAVKLDLFHREIDELNWQAGWIPSPREVLVERVRDVVRRERWILDGNYGSIRHEIWPMADTVVWLDYPLALTLWQVTTRTFVRALRRDVLWGTNRESLRMALLSRESIIYWAATTHGEHRRTYPEILSSPENAHLRVVRLRSRAATRRFLGSIG